MKAEQYFTENATRAQTALTAERVNARKVSAGETAITTFMGSLLAEITADEDGWEVSLGGKYQFVSDADFACQFTRETVTPTRDLPSDATAVPVSKGESYISEGGPFGLAFENTADQDGWVVTQNARSEFMSDSEFHATFRTAALPAPAGTPSTALVKAATEKQDGLYRYIPPADSTPVRYIVLEEETTFDFKSGEYTIPAGSVIYENPADEDGYTVGTADYFEQRFVSAEKILTASAAVAVLPPPAP